MHKCSIILHAACTFRPYKNTPVLKLFRTFSGKMTRGLSLQMVFSPLFLETLLTFSDFFFFSSKVRIEPLSTPSLGLQGSRGSRKINKSINCSPFLLYTLISKDKKRIFPSKVGIELPSTSLLGFQGSRGSRKKNVFGGTVRKHRRSLHCPVASADKKSRGARAPG